MERRSRLGRWVITFLSVAVLVGVPSWAAGDPQCRVVDAAGADLATEEGAIKDGMWDVCSVGGYVVWAPIDKSDQSFIVMREQSPVVSFTLDSLLVYERGWKVLASVADRDGDGAFEFVDYEVRAPGEVLGHEVWDADRDGCADLRIVDQPEGRPKTEVKFMGRWLELVRKGDQHGYIHDGVFREMSSALGEAFDQAVSECVTKSDGTAN